MNLNKREELIHFFEQYNKMLTQTQRQAFHLHYIEDLSLKEISEITATTRSAIFDAIKKAEKKLLSINEKLS
ncbi:sigma factor-like helix-turn-helix DNA-binding protein [Candidatus Mycoplasma mahonii]|uniref:sigma factor-like helix-turn-helix DNA-binding protein n=1 Tax=Candidatus Mycoplasma mahonii TaxID=3004105 RepID=UPI0026ED092B|nr:sigma factor-like helix-turn-helix DNA-binding protein [Candidatus Mycoplasma mahonii]WKX02529.1 sigma factor-like helix-turn-helix DNA-binding protein [Candidatus Mycoplasma mahonii]